MRVWTISLLILLCSSILVSAEPIFSIEPVTSYIGEQMVFNVSVSVEPQEFSIWSLQYKLSFDPDVIEILSTTKGSFLRIDGTPTYAARNCWNNTQGEFEYAETRIGSGAGGVTQQGISATITFLSKENLPNESYINFRDAFGQYVEGENLIEYSADMVNGTVKPGQPDLIVSDFWLNWPIDSKVLFTIKNLGPGDVQQDFVVGLYAGGLEYDTITVNTPLMVGESINRSFSRTWNHSSEKVMVIADINEDISEMSETNNHLDKTWVCGDVNGNGKATVADVTELFNILNAGEIPSNPWAADVSMDGKVTVSDVVCLFDKISMSEPCECMY